MTKPLVTVDMSVLVNVIREGVMDGLTTTLSRVLINHLRNMPSWDTSTQLLVQVPNSDLMVKFLIARKDNISIIKIVEGYFNEPSQIIHISIYLPREKNYNLFAGFIPRLKNVLRHELEHYRQMTRTNDLDSAVHGYQGKLPQYFNARESPEKYFLNPREIEAYVMGSYKEAKTRKKPFEEVLEKNLYEVHQIIRSKLPPQEAAELTMKIKDAWINYIRIRFSLNSPVRGTTLTEGVMDDLTTKLSREIVNWLKSHKEKETTPTFKSQVGDLFIRVEFERAPGALRTSGGFFSVAYNEISIKILLPEVLKLEELSKLIPELKNLLRHELEHYRQTQRGSKINKTLGTHYTAPNTNSGDRYTFGDIYKNVADARAYFLQPIEVEAIVMGLYKQAKTSKVPLMELIASFTTKIGNSLYSAGVPRTEAFQTAKEIYDVWKNYAQKRLSSKIQPFGVMD